MTGFDTLANVALHPEMYGDSIELRTLNGGGLAITPFDQEGRLDDSRTLVLDPDQVKTLTVRLKMDIPEIVQRVGEHMETRIREGGANGLGLAVFVLLSACFMAGLVIGGAIFGFLF